MRVLGRVRLSRGKDESTSPERQRELIAQWSAANGHEVIGWAEDIDVSRSVDPFKTPALGAWLTPEKAAEWDIIAGWKLDRIATGSIYLNKMIEWCGDNSKSLVSVTENFDLSTWVGRMIANVIAGVAEGELEAIRERTQGSRVKLVQLGRWTGGRPTYGYRKVKIPEGGWQLEHDPVSAPIVHRIVDLALQGTPSIEITRILNRERVLTPADFVRERNGKPVKNAVWKVTPLLELLRSRTLLGQIVANDRVVRDDVGNPVLGGPPLLTQDQFDRLQAELDSRGRKPVNKRMDASPLLGVAVCYDHGKNLYHQRQMSRGRYYRYYKSETRCCTQSIPAERLETLVQDEFLEQLGDVEVFDKVFVPAESHESELKAAVDAVDELTPLMQVLASDTAKKRVRDQLTSLDARIAELEKLPTRAAGYRDEPTGETHREVWEQSDEQGRRALLLKSGIKVRAKLENHVFYAELMVPEDIQERMR